VARLLELPIGGGGGPALEALAKEGDPTAVPLPIPMQKKRNFDFSFAGLKTAVRLAVERTPEEVRHTRQFHADVAASFQHAAFSHLEQRLKFAMQYCARLPDEPPSAADAHEAAGGSTASAAEGGGAVSAAGRLPGTLVVSGGVAANQELRRRLQALCDATPAPGDTGKPWKLVVPPPRLCTDNGVMVAWAAVEALKQGRSHEAEGQEVRARWPLGRLAQDAVVPKGTKSARSDLRKGVAA